MIDLRKKGLPNTINVGGSFFSIKTDFREWLKFSDLIKKERPLTEYLYLFKNDFPKVNFSKELIEFFINKNETPNDIGIESSGAIPFDYILDGEYIIGSFWSQYKIDLTECDMHWHKFQALFRCLEPTTKIGEIMAARCYRKDNSKIEEQYKRNKKLWELSKINKTEKEEITNELKALFYNA